MPLHVNATDLDTIIQVFYRELPDAKVYAFGSRVSDNEPNSEADLDLAIMTGHIISTERMIAIERSMAEAGLPFTVDVFDYAKLTNKLKDLVEEKHIAIRGTGKFEGK
ncbi:MAG: nucleotidyltransferase domain-containing protein [Fibromonadaceae bacterium]|jgi:predicted nucleotidyltransferase|nr:nucleotidyltransferase domain-containing protein [Fibromonadaceae bacterium]